MKRECACGAPITRHSKTGLCVTCSRQQQSQERRKPAANPNDSVSVRGDQAEVTKVVPGPVRTLAALIRVCEIDTEEWEVERWVANKWEMGSVNRKSGATQTTDLYQIKAWLRRKVAVIDAREELRDLLDSAKRDVPPRPPVSGSPEVGPYMLELHIPDLHAGKLAWSQETGYQNYDTSIALRLWRRAVEALLDRTRIFPFERIILVLGNDLLHADNKTNTTFKGTPLDTDSRYHKVFARVRQTITETIDQLRQIAPVEAIMVPGNHDTLSVWHLGDSLECYYHKDDRVKVLNAPTSRKYVEHGTVMILYTHGDKGKQADYPLLMATEAKEMFGRTKFHEIHTGHLHQTRLLEKHGIRVRISPALCPPDAWHAENGYVGQLRGAEAFVWHRDSGLVSMAFYHPDLEG